MMVDEISSLGATFFKFLFVDHRDFDYEFGILGGISGAQVVVTM